MPDRTFRFRHIDAFASEPFTGNSAAVYSVDAFPADDLMQRIAREHNLSETAFYTPDDTGEADFVLRWFTPTVEVEMCGHATLASGHAALSAGGRARERRQGQLPHREGSGRSACRARRRGVSARPSGLAIAAAGP